MVSASQAAVGFSEATAAWNGAWHAPRQALTCRCEARSSGQPESASSVPSLPLWDGLSTKVKL